MLILTYNVNKYLNFSIKEFIYGHFGRDDPDFRWEKTDKAEILKKDAGM